MGYTQFSLDKVKRLIEWKKPTRIMDLGAQNNFAQPLLPAPYISEWYKKKNIEYYCIDLNGENNSFKIDLSKPLTEPYVSLKDCFYLLVDNGTSEHVGNEKSEFDWEAIYNCWLIKHNLLCIDGLMYSENPKTGNWFGHGRQYYTQEFYTELAKLTDYEIIDLGEHAACNNVIDGWNIYCTMIKHSDTFPTLEQFKTLPLKQS